MQVFGTSVGQTPAFRIFVADPTPWRAVWGAVAQADGWAFPAYWPFGELAFRDLATVARAAGVALAWDATSLPLLAALRDAAEAWRAAEAAYAAGARVALPVGDDFFPPDYAPFAHQRLGIARLYHAWRVYVLWDMGTGKTKTVVDTLRILRRENRFRRALVVVPPVVLPTWEREVARCARGALTTHAWTDAAPAGDADVVLVTYARLRLEHAEAEVAAAAVRTGRGGYDRNRAVAGLPPVDDAAWAALRARAVNRLAAIDYDTVVFDESHYLGNHDAQQTQAALALTATGKAARRYLLSGTAADHPAKLYSQLRALAPALLPMAWQAYQDRYMVRDKARRYIVLRYKGLNELNAKVDSVAIRMRKRDCLDLPPLTVTDVTFALGRRQRARYNELVLETRASFAPALGYAAPNLPDPADRRRLPLVVADQPPLFGLPHGAARVTKLLQVVSGFLFTGADLTVCDACPSMSACVAAKVRPYTAACRVVTERPPTEVVRDVENPKLELFEDLLAEVLASDDTNKVLCWGVFRPELDDMEAVLRRRKVGYVRIADATPRRIRAAEERFAADPACRVWLSQVAAGIGINLASANYAIYYALPWDRPQYQQSLERNNRPGQTRAMTAYRLLGEGTLDRYVAEVLAHKDHIAFTLVEKIACAQCDDQARCAPLNIRPFRAGCKYRPYADRPIAQVGVVT